MGGHQAGEVAAELAVASVRQVLGGRDAQRTVEQYVARADLETRRAVFACLRRAFEEANKKVRAEAEASPERRGMGATLDVVWLARGNAFVAHAGDGRVYLARLRAMLQLTQDHAHPMLPVTSRQRNAGITNAIGLNEVPLVDTLFVDVARGERLLLCTDGVHGQIEAEAELAEIVRAGSAEDAARALVARAGQSGRDNATAIVIEIGERFVKRTDQDRGLKAADLERARQSPLLAELPQAFALSALAAAVEVEFGPNQPIPRLVTNDLVTYIVLDGVVRYPSTQRNVGAGALLFPESLVGIVGQEDLPIASTTVRLLRVRADDFSEVCRDPRLAAELYRRLAAHIARVSLRPR
jgi:serine/threonine protein phosphatase PrpC